MNWAAAEGWNPGLDDLAAFHRADPGGFLMGWIGDTPVASISVVKYGKGYGFLGFYIVASGYRGHGYGMAIWNAGMTYLAGRTVGLDGVIDQQDNYRKSGFVLVGNNIRYSGVPKLSALPTPTYPVQDLVSGDIAPLLTYDQPFFPADRSRFLRGWVTAHKTMVAKTKGNITGYGTIRKCHSGYKIGPLFADSPEIAQSLLAGLCASIPAGQEIALDTPQSNPAASRLAASCGLTPAFETARMYRGEFEPLLMHNTYGITSFELG